LVKICHILNVENFVNPSKDKPWQRLTFPPDTTKVKRKPLVFQGVFCFKREELTFWSNNWGVLYSQADESKKSKVSKLSWKLSKNDSFPESNCGRGKWIFRETFPPIFWVILVKICHILNVENFVNPSKNRPWQRLTFPPENTLRDKFIWLLLKC
jgi:hypothetical protein